MTHNNNNYYWENFKSIALILIAAFIIRTVGFGLYKLPPSGSMETTLLDGESVFADKFSYWITSPKRGDIIACNSPKYEYSSNPVMKLWQNYVWGPDNWTKRVIGLPGDHVKGVIEDGKPVVYVNGQKLDEPYVNKYPLIRCSGEHAKSFDPNCDFQNQPFYRINQDRVITNGSGQVSVIPAQTPITIDEFDVNLGPTEYWLMGDNRLNSADSRVVGPVEGSLIHGKIIFRIFSIDSNENWMILDLLKHPIDFFKRIRWSRCLNIVR